MSAINWLSTAFLFAFVAISPLVIYVLHKGGPKLSIMICASLILVGNWIRYAGTKAGPHYGVAMFGQILIGFSQPFVLAAPTRYSDLWFTNRGRIAATAVMSLANPLGGALAQLINPFWASDGHPEQIPMMVLYVSIIVSTHHIICSCQQANDYRQASLPYHPSLFLSRHLHPLQLQVKLLSSRLYHP